MAHPHGCPWPAGERGLIGVVRKRIGIVTTRRQLHTMFLAQRANVVRLRLREIRHIDVTHAAIRPVLLSLWPTHGLDALVTFAGPESQHLVQ
jgi:hypothetical protein